MLALSTCRGVFPPILTPLTADERVDHSSLRRLTTWLLERGANGIWVMGSTGEFAHLDAQQRARAIETVVDTVNGRVPVIAGISDAGTELTVRHGHNAREAGASAVAATPPYYYPPDQVELLRHYRRIHQAVDLPLFLYNFPQMVKVKLELSTALILAEEGAAVGIKDSQNDLEWFRQLMIAVRERGLDFRGFLGTRLLIDAAVAVGAHGVIPSVSNMAPRACVQAFAAAEAGELEQARQCQERALRFEKLARVAPEGSPFGSLVATAKAILQSWGVIEHAVVARPFRTLEREEQDRLAAMLKAMPEDTRPELS